MFVGRDYVLTELSLPECAEFWKPGAADLNPREIFDVLSVTGGVPRYLEEVDPGLSAEENVRRLCFRKEGVLFKDFDAIFHQMFGAAATERRRILELLADGPASGAELAPKLETDRKASSTPIRASIPKPAGSRASPATVSATTTPGSTSNTSCPARLRSGAAPTGSRRFRRCRTGAP